MAKYDYNIVVIGAGSGGLVSSYIAAAVNAKVALIEKHKMGGDCLNTGCVPSKAIISCAKIASLEKKYEEYGFKSVKAEFEFADVMERIQKVIKKVEPHDSIERYTKLGVDCYNNYAKIVDKHTVKLDDGTIIKAKNIIISTGARPAVPPIKGLDQVNYLTSDNVWNLRKQPKKLVVLGGGPIGSELAQSFSRLGSEVFQIERSAHLLSREDIECSKIVEESFKKDGINVYTKHQAKEVVVRDGKKIIICESAGKDVEIEFDEILIALGRRANVKGFGLEELGVKLRDNGTIDADPFLRTNIKNIYVVGDVTGPYQFTHTAAHQAYYAAVNALFNPFTRWISYLPFGPSFKVNYRVIPACTFTDPEVARVGLNEKEAQQKNIKYDVTVYGLDDLDRAIADGEDRGFVKVLTKKGSDKILGAMIIGVHGGDLLAEFVLAMNCGLGLNSILSTIHTYPTMSEAIKYTAGVWKNNNKPEGILKLVKKFHNWRR